MKRIVTLGPVLAAELAAVAVVVALRDVADPRAAGGPLPGDAVAAAALWWALLACTAWMLPATLLAVVARSCSALAALGRVEALLPRVIRYRLDRAVAAGVGTALLATTPAAASAPAPVVRAPFVIERAEPVVRDREPVTATTAPPATLFAEPAARREPVPRAGPRTVPLPRPERPAPRGPIHVVAPGENLWQIARATLASRGSPPSNEQVASYWRATVALNRATLRSGNPNLIYPGEAIELPAD
jgi:hypothetical protein